MAPVREIQLLAQERFYSTPSARVTRPPERSPSITTLKANSIPANGEFTLYFNTTGERNTATGDSALYSNTTGNLNTAIGNAALLTNTSGNRNTAIGAMTLFLNTAGDNTATGASAHSANTPASLTRPTVLKRNL